MGTLVRKITILRLWFLDFPNSIFLCFQPIYDVRMSSQTITQGPQSMDCYASMSNTTFHSVHVLLNYLSMHSLVVIIEGKTSKPLFNINMCVSLLLFCVLYSSAKIWRIQSKISGIAWALGFKEHYTPPGWDLFCSPCRLYGPTYRSSPHNLLALFCTLRKPLGVHNFSTEKNLFFILDPITIIPKEHILCKNDTFFTSQYNQTVVV